MGVYACPYMCLSMCAGVCVCMFTWVCVHMCACVCRCMYVFVCVHVHTCTYVCRSLSLALPYLRQGPLLFNAESARVADPWVSGNFTLSVFHLPLGLDKWFCNGSHKDFGHSNSSPYAYIANILPLGHLPSPVTSILYLFMQTVPELKAIPPFLPSWFQNFLFMFSFWHFLLLSSAKLHIIYKQVHVL